VIEQNIDALRLGKLGWSSTNDATGLAAPGADEQQCDQQRGSDQDKSMR